MACCASNRTRYPLAPCIPFVSERRRGFPQSRVSPRPGTGRAIGLPALRVVRDGFAVSSSRKTHRVFRTITVGRHNRARVAFCLPCRHGLGDALSGTVWWPSSSGRTPIQPPVFARCAYPHDTLPGCSIPAVVAELSDSTPVPRNRRFLVCERDAKRLVNAVNGGAFSSNFLVITIRHFLPADAVRPRNDAHRRGR